MKLSSLTNLIPLNITGTLSPFGAESVGIILSIGIVIALIGWISGKFWFMPYLDYRQKVLGKRNSIKPAKSNVRKVANITRSTDARKD